MTQQEDYVRTQVRMPPELHKRLSDYAKEKGTSLNTSINLFVENSLNNHDAENTAIQFGEVNGSTLEESAMYVSDFFQRHNQYRLINIETINSNGIRYWYSFPKSENQKMQNKQID